MPSKQLEDDRLQVQQHLQELDRELVQAIKQREVSCSSQPIHRILHAHTFSCAAVQALKKAMYEKKAAEARRIELKQVKSIYVQRVALSANIPF